MQRFWILPILLLVFIPSFAPAEQVISPDTEKAWGFFGHRRINRLAVFTLPAELAGFYKQNIEFITEHAVDPDKRRYATRFEAIRHYIDIDHWGEYPFAEVPRNWTDALMKYTEIGYIDSQKDSFQVFGKDLVDNLDGTLLFMGGAMASKINGLSQSRYRTYFQEKVLPQYYEEEWQLDCDQLKELLNQDFDCEKVYAVDHFSPYGVLPYNLVDFQRRLTDAFIKGDVERILRISTELGHYIGDAHVPLHTTENYNGQMTNQDGIHAFWESRLPELYADQQYDFFVGPASYIEDPNSYYWDVVLTSHSHLDSVLAIEKDLSETFPRDKQYCYEDRLNRTIRTQCKEYAAAYHQRLGGMVEARMRATIQAVGSAWYTAWVDAGKPNVRKLGQLEQNPLIAKKSKELDELYSSGESKGRKHE